LDESAFEHLADATLGDYLERLDAAIGDVADVDLQGGILTIALDRGGEYVLNKHAPMRQLWLSSPVSGARHFDPDPASGGGVDSRGEARLAELLAGELARTTGREVALA